MGAIEVSLMVTAIRIRRYKTQFRRALSRDRRSDFRPQARSLAAKRDHDIRDSQAARDDDMHQHPPAIRRRRNLLYKKTVNTVRDAAVCQGDIECPLNLAAELLSFSFYLPARRRTAALVVIQSIHEVWINEMWFPGTTTMLFQKAILYCTANTRSINLVLMNAMGASQAGRLRRRRAGSTASGVVQ